MTKRSLDVFDYRLELYASEDSSITGTCPRTSPNKDPTRSDRWRKMKAKKMYLGAKREVKQLRWHRGKYDDLGRATVDATERMPCKVREPRQIRCTLYVNAIIQPLLSCSGTTTPGDLE